MQFPNTYFEDEVREGFFVPGVMKRAWAAQLEVLEEIAKVCEKYHIKWFLDCGTLLGAVRHGGYIPWDDDLDICMLRDDYIRFNELAAKELPEGYVVLNVETEAKFKEMLTRVTNGRHIRLDRKHLEKYHEYPYIAGIDIFPLDYVSTDVEAEVLRKKIAKIVSDVIPRINEDNRHTAVMERTLERIETMCDVKFTEEKPIRQQLYILLDKIYALYTEEEATEVALMPYWVECDSHKYPLECFEKTILMPYEITELPVPIMYENILRIEYGDYMKNVRSGGVHDYPLYKVHEEQLAKRSGGNLPYRYVFSEEELHDAQCREYAHHKQWVKKIVRGLWKEHKKIGNILRQTQWLGEERQSVLEMLVNCQEQAISLGTLLEEKEGDGFTTVGLLESYCEEIYSVYQVLADEIAVKQTLSVTMSVEQMKETLDKRLKQIDDSIQNDIKKRKEIVFLPYKASAWMSFESVWRAAMDEPDCDVYVVPIPYYDKKGDNTYGDMHYEGDKYPSYVPITHYDNYSFEEHHPDIIFIHNPYDDCNYTTTVHPFFYASNLKKYTDELVYTPYFLLEEINPDDAHAAAHFCRYITVPGVVHADKVIVQSEQMKRTYIEALTAWAGEGTRNVWEEKILGIGSPIQDNETLLSRDDMEIPEDWRKKIIHSDGDYKKIVLYNTSVSALLEHKGAMLEKMQEVFQVFYENREDITLLWRPHPLIRTTLETTEPVLWREYCEIVEQYKKQDWGIYDDSAELDRAVELCDAYYGDKSSIAQMCSKAGKPVMIQAIF